MTEIMLGDGGGVGEVAGFALQYQHPIVIAFVGMAFEAKIAAGPGVLVVCRNNRHDLATVAGHAARKGYRGIISFGVAGGLAANLRTGDWVVASNILGAHVPDATEAARAGSLVWDTP